VVKALAERDMVVLPPAYAHVLGALGAGEPACSSFTLRGWCVVVKRLYNEAKRLLAQRYSRLVELANTGCYDSFTAEEISELNRELSAMLKELEALSYIVNALSGSRVLDQDSKEDDI